MAQEVLLAAITTGLVAIAGWAAWMSKTVVNMLTLMERISVSADRATEVIEAHEQRLEQHHKRLAALDAS